MKLRRYLVSGVVFWLPIVISYWVVQFLVDMFDHVLLVLPENARPDQVIGHHIPGLGLLLVILLLVITGVCVSNFIGRSVSHIGDKIVARIPFINTVYSGVKQALGVLLADNSRSFREVVLVEFPKKNSYALAFVTNLIVVQDNRTLVTVYIPTTPNPTSGFILNLPQEQTMKINLTIDEAFKYVVSLGTIVGDDIVEKLRDKIHEFDENKSP